MTDQPSIELATGIVTAWLANPHTRANPEEVRGLLTSVHATVQAIGQPPIQPPADAPAPAKPPLGAKASLKIVGRIISMLDGKPYASLTRHLKSHGLTPEAYRQRFGLPASYPMVAPAYSEARRAIAKTLGLGRKPTTVEAPEEPAKPTRGKGIGAAKRAAQAHLGGKG